MGHRHVLLALLGLLFAISGLNAQRAHRYLRQGNEAYEEQDYKSAEEYYRKSLTDRGTAKGNYNLGNAIYQQGRYKESIRRFEHAAQTAKDEEAKASAFHNLGNAYLQEQEYEKAVESYKNSLRLRPTDQSTKYNLAMAQRLMMEEKRQQEQQQQDQDQQQQEQQQDQQQSGQGQGQQDQQQQQQSSPGQQDQQQSEPNASQDPRQGAKPRQEGQALTQEEAQRLLQIIEEEELRVLEKMRNQQNTPAKKTDKDW